MSEEKPKLLPKGGTKDCVVAMKILMAVVTIIDVLGNAIIQGRETEEVSFGEKTFSSVFTLTTTLLNFGFSYVSGCQCYSPMDPGDQYENLEYSKKLTDVKRCTDGYTFLWWFKTSVAVFQGVVGVVAGLKKENLESWYSKTAYILNVASCGVSFVLEVAGDVCAGLVTVDNTSFMDESDDKKIYICDTTSYLLDDIRGIMDAAYALGLKKMMKGYVKGGYIAAEAVIGLGSGVCLILTAAFVSESHPELVNAGDAPGGIPVMG